ncbi:MAG: hypothetical protein LBC57_06415, partial [Treponema sp.]|nr:hypothetical protein [Treponema sp.]
MNDIGNDGWVRRVWLPPGLPPAPTTIFICDTSGKPGEIEADSNPCLNQPLFRFACFYFDKRLHGY